MLELCASRQKPPSDHSVSVCWGCASKQHASSQLAPPRATRSAPVAWALCAPGACGEPDLRLALRARRTALALRAEGQGALGARRCAPVCRAAPGGAAAGCHRRLALCARRRWRGRCAPGRLRCASRQKPPSVSVCWLCQHASWRRLALRARRRWRGRCAPGRLRQPSRGLALRARRRWRGRCAPGRLHVFPPITHALPLGGGHVVVEDAVRFALLETLGAMRASRSCRGRGWGGGSQTSSCTSVPGERLRATAACAVRVGAPRHCNRSALPPGQADPPHFERARAAARRLRGAS